ncbi:MAG: EscU/YscU/HrcU family type III secretion system export apparatus switch protein, partial [Geminicoccaceae bacterium]|nr:EscU/YscU/HrcU family type III secretion system export apparatus switch protein [Geminicoccaceae bacterium]
MVGDPHGGEGPQRAAVGLEEGDPFGRQGAIELVKSLAKAALLLGVGAAFLWNARGLLLGLSVVPLEVAMPALADRAALLFLTLAAGLLVIAGGDLPVQFLQ